jgi:hypothetical protein
MVKAKTLFASSEQLSQNPYSTSELPRLVLRKDFENRNSPYLRWEQRYQQILLKTEVFEKCHYQIHLQGSKAWNIPFWGFGQKPRTRAQAA